jgi:hypothetical protein
MRIVVKDFNVKPSDNLVAGFEYAYAVAPRNLDTIEGVGRQGPRRKHQRHEPGPGTPCAKRSIIS